MQNIVKTDTNSPGSRSQQEHRQERALKAVRNRRQVRFSDETKEQRQAKLETERDGGTDEDNGRLRQRPHLHARGRQRNESGDCGLSHKVGFSIRLILNWYEIEIGNFLSLVPD